MSGAGGNEESSGRSAAVDGSRDAGARAPAPEPGSDAGGDGAGWQLFVRDVASSVFAVVLVGFFLFAVSGVWPPLVAVESGSMLPNMQRNDLVFVMEADRFPGPGDERGVVTADAATGGGYEKFDRPGDVIVYRADGRADRTPIIHRAMLYVEAGENWYDRANPSFVGGADACELDDDPDTDTGLRNCPAPHAGFITKGDNNGNYDQATGLSEPVKPSWVVGTAEFRIPGLGWIRLQSGG
jgi:signal peptidase